MTNLPVENNHLEYKETTNHTLPKSLWETVSAFANTDGGKIMLGISEVKKNAIFKPIGVKNPNKLKIEFLNLQNDKHTISQPVVSANDIETVNIDEKNILIITVPKVSYGDRPIYIKGNIQKAYFRDHESDRQVSDKQLRYFLREADSNIDSELLENFDLTDLDLISLQNYRVFLAQQTGNEEYLDNKFPDFLKAIGLMQKNRQKSSQEWQLKKAALLLFGKFNAIIEIFPNFFLDFIIKQHSSDTDYLDRVYTSNEPGHPQNIYSFFEQVLTKIKARLTNKFELNGISRKDNGDILFAAIREGLVNTLIHADYSAESQIKISFYNDYIDFRNPGELRISKERYVLGGISEARNPSLFSTFTRAKLGERTGSGGHRIYQTADKLKLRSPELTTDLYSTQLIIWTIPLVESVLNTIPDDWKPTYTRMSKLLVSAYSELQDLYKSSYEGHKILNDMIEAGLLEKTGKNKGTKYMLSENEPARRMSMNHLIRQFQTKFLK